MSDRSLVERVEQRTSAARSGQSKTMDEWISNYAGDFAAALPGAVKEVVSSQNFVRFALNELRYQPQLRECEVPSVIGGLMAVAQLGLRLGAQLGEAYLIPFDTNVGDRERPVWVKKAQLIIGYHGYQVLAERTGKVRAVTADVVRDRDDWDFYYDNEGYHVRHRPAKLGTERGQMVGAFAATSLLDGSVIARAVDLEEIDKAKSRSKSGKNNKGPWATDYAAMAMKTAVRRLWPWLPKSEEGAAAFAADTRTFNEIPREKISEQPVLDQVSDIEDAEVVEPPPAEQGTEPVMPGEKESE